VKPTIEVTSACAVLAGGKSSRMGRDKAFIQVGGAPIIQRTIGLLKKIFEEIIIVTNTPADYALYEKDSRIVTDIIKDIGPLGGIHSALSYTSKRSVFFVACDMPFLHNDMVVRQLELFNKTVCDAFLPKIGNFIEPLHAVYRKELKDKLFSFIKSSNDHSIRGWLKTVNTAYFDIEDNPGNRSVFKNMNTPGDLE